jgi:hypothetical protein
MNQALPNEKQMLLREEKIITDNEVAMQLGDKYIAENVITKERRLIHVPERIMENRRRVLKG